MKRRAVRGTTVVEALIVLLIGSVVITVTLGLMNFAFRSMSRTEQRLDPREQATQIVALLRRHLMDAKFYMIKDEGLTLLYAAPYEFGSMHFDAATKSVLDTPVKPPGKPETIGAGVNDFSIHQVSPGLIRLTLMIERPLVHDGMPQMEALRLVEEIHCPAASRMRMIPWNQTEHRRGRGRRGGGGEREGRDREGQEPEGSRDELGTPRAVVAPPAAESPSVLDSFKSWLGQ